MHKQIQTRDGLVSWRGVLLAAVTFSLLPVASMADGRKAFLGQSCNDCHTVKSQNIDLSDAADPEEAKDASDLSTIGDKRDRRWIAQFLLRQIKDEDGDEHPRRFRGEREDLATVATWLGELKSE